MKKLIWAFCLCLAGGVALPPTAVAGDEQWSVIFDKAIPIGRVVATVKGDGKPVEYGPLLFLGHRSIKSATDTVLSQQEAPYLKGFAAVPAFFPGEAVKHRDKLGSNIIASQIMFAGTTAEYRELINEFGTESTINGKGVAQTLIGGGLLAAGALLNNQWLGALGMASTGASNSDFGSFIKDDPSWFKTVGNVPSAAKWVNVVRTWIDRRDENKDFVRISVYTTVFSNSDEPIDVDQQAKIVAQSYLPILKPMAPSLTDFQRAWLNENGWARLDIAK